MEQNEWLKIRISSSLKEGLKKKYGKGVSGAVRDLIEKDLGQEKVVVCTSSNLGVIKNVDKLENGALLLHTEKPKTKEGKLSVEALKEMVAKHQIKKK